MSFRVCILHGPLLAYIASLLLLIKTGSIAKVDLELCIFCCYAQSVGITDMVWESNPGLWAYEARDLSAELHS